MACVAVWLLLGAVLNPNSFLPFAIGVMTMFAFVTTRIERVKKLTAELETRILHMLEKKLGTSLTSSLKKNVYDNLKEGRAPSVDEVRPPTSLTAGATVSVVPSKTRPDTSAWVCLWWQLVATSGVLINSTPLGALAKDLGVDLGDIAAASHGDDDALRRIAERLDIDVDVVGALVALAFQVRM